MLSPTRKLTTHSRYSVNSLALLGFNAISKRPPAPFQRTFLFRAANVSIITIYHNLNDKIYNLSIFLVIFLALYIFALYLCIRNKNNEMINNITIAVLLSVISLSVVVVESLIIGD